MRLERNPKGGSGNTLPFDGEYMVQKEVILVTINYRLGVWGFLCHPLLINDKDGSCGNYGLWDQIAALDWIRENIAAFGGDPENITLFGQSAGAVSLQILALSPLTRGKYKKMILQSGGGYKSGILEYRTAEQSYSDGEEFFQILGINGGADNKEKILQKLHTMPSKVLMDAAEKVYEDILK